MTRFHTPAARPIQGAASRPHLTGPERRDLASEVRAVQAARHIGSLLLSRGGFTEYGDAATRKNTCRGNPVEEISALFVVSLDGTGRRQITPWGARNGNADWSPDGRRIVYEGGVDPCRNGAYAVAVVDADGKHVKRLTNDSWVTGNGNPKPGQFEGSFDPTWSPDGTKVLFSHDALPRQESSPPGCRPSTPTAPGSSTSPTRAASSTQPTGERHPPPPDPP